MTGSKIFAFGPQALSFDSNSLKTLRAKLHSNGAHDWAKDVFSALPTLLASFSSQYPKLNLLNTQKKLQLLVKALEIGEAPSGLFPLSNSLLSPLVVVSQLTDFLSWIRSVEPTLEDSSRIPSSIHSDAETVGLCTGILSAFAVASSATIGDLKRYGAVGIRLAMLTGAIVDVENNSRETERASASFSASWVTSSLADLESVLQRFPEAYISVKMDEKRATVTCAQTDLASIQKALKEKDIHVSSIALTGRFHWPAHHSDVLSLVYFVNNEPTLQFINASDTILPTRSNKGGPRVELGQLHDIAIRAILTEQSHWYQTMDSLYQEQLQHPDSKVLSFGPERPLPPTIIRKLGSRISHVTDSSLSSFGESGNTGNSYNGQYSDRIAIIGASCQMPNAEDLDEFWQVLSSGQSQHREVPSDRFSLQDAAREIDPKIKWFGNFCRDIDVFDHKFFKKSPHEMKSTDPQHRVGLQLAYQAVQQSGYFGIPDFDKHIGVYIGHANTDYEHNIRGYAANAYSATGNLKSFLAGKISHYFGWTGPSLTLDTACSSSSVAIHLACNAILSGEITGALAGGVNLFTSPQWYHNLAGASFLSQTGQCKSFDAKGDGYCRGEGAGLVFMKKLSAAIADGDQILGVIAGTSVLQNQNCTPITVPNGPSLADLFRGVVERAKMKPHDISVVEAHGTGTKVGDPAEYDGIRQVFGGPTRPSPLTLTAVKGSVGHTEVASGAASIIKVLLMMQEGAIPPQASFQTPNPDLNIRADDNIEITTVRKSWSAPVRSALINNYGASGSNASLVITEAPKRRSGQQNGAVSQPNSNIHPVWLTGNDENSLRRYSSKLRQFLLRKKASGNAPTMANLSFQLAKQSNRTLGHALVLTAASVEDLDSKLSDFEKAIGASSFKVPDSRPVIMCFGGQISTFVGLDKELFENVAILRKHLLECDAIVLALGLDSIFPAIFQRSPLENTVKLQTALFAAQYSCAMAWIDSGVQVSAIVGHSFGELTGLCVSGALTLRDAIHMISERAKIIQNMTATDKGSMMAVEGDLADVESLIATTNAEYTGSVSIACYNSPRSYTIGGPTTAIKAVEQKIKSNATSNGLRVKVLNVTNAFHSSLVDPITAELVLLGQNLTFSEPKIRLERATEKSEITAFDGEYFSKHLRSPVYFRHAVERLANEYHDAIWLEAGSNSTITNMAGKVLANNSSGAFFQPVNITTDNSHYLLVDATTKLWRQGLQVNFWAHHRSQASDYSPILLPPYQFEKNRHWMDIKVPSPSVQETPAPIAQQETGLVNFFSFLDDSKRSVRFHVNTNSPEFVELCEAHVMASTVSVLPGMLPVEIAIDAVTSLRPEFQNFSYQPELQDMVYYCPLVPQHSSAFWLDVTATDPTGMTWEWNLIGQNSKGISTRYISASLVFNSPHDRSVKNEFARLSRLGSHKRCTQLLDGTEPSDVVVGRNIYRAFETVIDYKDPFRILTKLVGSDVFSAGRVVRAHDKKGWLDSVLTDGFSQVGGVAVNLFSDAGDFAQRGIYIGDRIERWVRAPGLVTDDSKPNEWEVFCMNHRESDNAFICDVFAFDARDGSLYEALLGIRYSKVGLGPIRKVLSKIVSDNPLQAGATIAAPQGVPQLLSFAASPTIPFFSRQQQPVSFAAEVTASAVPSTNGTFAVNGTQAPAPAQAAKSSGSHIPAETKEILSNLSGVEVEDIKNDSDLIEMGIDSLMAMELIREVDSAFKVTLETDQLMDLTDFNSLVVCISKTLGVDVSGTTNGEASSAPAVNGAAATNGFHDGANVINGTHAVNGVNGINGLNGAASSDNSFPPTTVLDVFRATKAVTDDFIVENKMENYYTTIRPRSTMLCAAYIVEAFEKMGCSVKHASPGQKLGPIPYLPKHEKFMQELYKIIGPGETNLVNIAGGNLVRTSVPCPSKPASQLFEEAVRDEPDHAPEFKLSALTGCQLAECLTGKADGLQIIFGSAEGRKVVSDVYAVAPINYTWIAQAAFFIEQLLRRLPANENTVKILEVGAGTGGTTASLVPMLAALGVPVTYTFTDLSSSLVAAARKRFKQYPFMQFKVANIEAPAQTELVRSQHIIVANACVHATRSLPISLSNMHNMLRPDGMIMLLEETEQLPWVDFVFGLLEGWWLFEDGRTHAQAPAEHWEKVLRGAGFGHVDYTDGKRREAQVQRIIFGFASDIRYAAGHAEPSYPITLGRAELTNITDRQAVINDFVGKYTAGFQPHQPSNSQSSDDSQDRCLLVTGATGSLGSHLVWLAAQMPQFGKIFCINRLGTVDGATRQRDAFEMRGIELEPSAQSKIEVLATDTTKPMLGLSPDVYQRLVQSTTHIVHSAWPMSLTRTTKAYKSSFQVIRHLIDLARDCASTRPSSFKFNFQFISSIGAVGYYPLWTGKSLAPETLTTADTALPVGYADAKIACEHILDQTLRQHPDRFRAMAVRIAQITGSRSNGYWNPVEHFSFFVKSAQYLRSLPDLRGTASWSPVDDVANSLIDILTSAADPYPIYHIENPARQPWPEMIQLLAKELAVPVENIVPYEQWKEKIRNCDASMTENPAKQLMDFWDKHYLRMSTGPLILSTAYSREHSRTMRESGPVEDELVQKYVRRWKLSGFLRNT